MAELMARQKAQPVALKRGEIVKGRITKLTRSEILVDINAKSEALVLERDKRLLNRLLELVKVGDVVMVSILNPESDAGNPLVSLRKFIEDKAWQDLENLKKKGEQIEASIADSTKGGYLAVMPNGLTGFLPFSHASFLQGQQLTSGNRITVSILELNRQENKIIFSQKSTITDEEFADIKKKFPIGQKLSTTIANITAFGIFVLIPISEKTTDKDQKTIDGLIHISEITWEKVEDIGSLYKVGDSIEAVIIGYDKDAKRTDLSIKRLSEDPFEAISKEYPIDKKVTGTVSKVQDGNVYVKLQEGTEGIIRKEKVPPTTTYRAEQIITVTVSGIDKRRHRIDLVPVLLEKPIGYR